MSSRSTARENFYAAMDAALSTGIVVLAFLAAFGGTWAAIDVLERAGVASDHPDGQKFLSLFMAGAFGYAALRVEELREK